MSLTASEINQTVLNYLRECATETVLQAQLREVTIAQTKNPQMMSPPEQAQFLQFMLKTINAKRVVEVGVFTGYATLAMAQVLPEEGYLLACDIKEEFLRLGQPFWKKAKVENKIDLVIQPAAKTLNDCIARGVELFDFAFVDADKPPYPEYYELLLQLVRPGGLIIFDNVLFVGEQIVPEKTSKGSQALCAFTQSVLQDPRVNTTLVPLGGGMLLARIKRSAN